MAKSVCRWPAPVYVASYGDGHSVRMSFWSDARKPIDLEAARAQAERHRPVKFYRAPHGRESDHWHPWNLQRKTLNPAYPLGIPTGHFVPLVSFHVEHMGQIVTQAAPVARKRSLTLDLKECLAAILAENRAWDSPALRRARELVAA